MLSSVLPQERTHHHHYHQIRLITMYNGNCSSLTEVTGARVVQGPGQRVKGGLEGKLQVVAERE